MTHDGAPRAAAVVSGYLMGELIELARTLVPLQGHERPKATKGLEQRHQDAMGTSGSAGRRASS